MRPSISNYCETFRSDSNVARIFTHQSETISAAAINFVPSPRGILIAATSDFSSNHVSRKLQDRKKSLLLNVSKICEYNELKWIKSQRLDQVFYLQLSCSFGPGRTHKSGNPVYLVTFAQRVRVDFEFLRDLHVDPLVKSFLHESESASSRWQDLLQHETRPTYQ